MHARATHAGAERALVLFDQAQRSNRHRFTTIARRDQHRLRRDGRWLDPLSAERARPGARNAALRNLQYHIFFLCESLVNHWENSKKQAARILPGNINK
jgi:hypothetical protein